MPTAAHLLLCAAAAAASAPGSKIIDASGAARASVAIRHSPGKGLGAFTTTPRRLGDVLGVYAGERMTRRARDARFLAVGARTPEDERWLASRHSRGVPVTGDYVLKLEADVFLDAEDPDISNWTRYINHDSNPNVGLFREKGEGGASEAWFIAIRTCRPGEELCFDYGPDYWVGGEQPVDSPDLMWGPEEDGW